MRPQRNLLVWLLLLWLHACARPQPNTAAEAPKGAHAQAPSTTPAGEASLPGPVTSATSATPGLFLYAASGPGGESHLLGTMHMGFGFDEVLTQDARARFQRANRVIAEADVSAADPGGMMQRALLPPGQALHTLLGEPTWSALLARLGPQIPPPVMDRLKPWLPAITLGLSDLESALQEVKPNSAPHMMDVEVMTAAKQAGKQLVFLESIDEQLAMFDAVPISEQVGELRRALSESSGKQGREMLNAFAAGDEEQLTQALYDPAQLAQAPGFYEVVLFQRNARWLPVLERELQRDGAFVAVGAAHLLGERGILAELRKRGYRVERVGAGAAN